MSDSALVGSVVVVTGGGNGIGRALAQRFAAEGARAVVIADLDAAAAEAAAATLTCEVRLGVGLDVTDEAAVKALADRVESELGPIDFYLSNAGVGGSPALGDNAGWNLAFNVHVMAHVYAARYVLPRMVERGSGHFLVTASAAGILAQIDAAPYSVTKHGSVALAEWLAIQYGDSGVEFSCLCPQGVRTNMTAGHEIASAMSAVGAFLETSDVADAVMTAIAEKRFLILPHPEVATYEQRRAGDRDRWLGGMRRIRTQLEDLRSGSTTEA